ncbi:protein of unknown function [Sinosporangium album]|uniref:Protein-glutamine gamma-glutamyltransferase-like C-terminal domain-containing protein n=1 Tax=Sinosporangium album TaxID=504805 RepID=A0A1G7VX63_9ACTN|nr:DUF4129 domain-containing protein [Sinosporangium album]SDG64307.1 protein of unknown function [Sinosporangium album]
MTPVDAERGEARGEAVQELLKPHYESEPLPTRLLRYVREFISDLLDSATGGTVGGIAAAILLVALLLALAGLLLWWARRADRGRRAVATGDLFGGGVHTAAEHRRAADALAAEGRWTEAIQERLRAVARDLEERALVDAMPGRTAGELAADGGRALPPLAADLAAAAHLFDDVTYGEVPGTGDGYATMRDLDERLRQARPVAAAGQPGGAP